jgi:hypothetical protein
MISRSEYPLVIKAGKSHLALGIQPRPWPDTAVLLVASHDQRASCIHIIYIFKRLKTFDMHHFWSQNHRWVHSLSHDFLRRPDLRPASEARWTRTKSVKLCANIHRLELPRTSPTWMTTSCWNEAPKRRSKPRRSKGSSRAIVSEDDG